jgi:hypothetical protein
LLLLSLYTAGSFAAFLLLEVAPRYMVSYHILFTLLAFEMVMGLRNRNTKKSLCASETPKISA